MIKLRALSVLVSGDSTRKRRSTTLRVEWQRQWRVCGSYRRHKKPLVGSDVLEPCHSDQARPATCGRVRVEESPGDIPWPCRVREFTRHCSVRTPCIST